MNLAALLGISPEMLNLLIFGLSLAVSIAHMRGNELPVLSALLRFLGGKPIAPAPAPDQPPSGPSLPNFDGHRLKNLLDRLDKFLGPEPAVSPKS